MSYHVAGFGSPVLPWNAQLARRRGTVAPRIIPFFGGVGGYGGAGGLGNDASKARLSLSKAAKLNELTASEVSMVLRVFEKYDKDFSALTSGKHGKTPAQAIAIIGPYPSIEKIVGHALVPPPPPSPLPGTSSSTSSDGSSGPPWGLILGGAAALAVGYAVTRRAG